MTPTLLKRIESWTAITLSAVVLTMMLVRLACAGGLWRDECALLQLATLPEVSGIFAHYPHEAFPPPFALLVRLWITFFGSGDLALRFYGLTIALLVVASLWLIFRVLSAGPPLLSLAGVGLSSAFLIWGTTLRGYGIGTLLILLTFGLIGRLLVKPTKRSAIAALIISIFTVQFVVQNIVLLVAVAVSAIVVLIARQQWRRTLVISTILVVSLLAFTPYVRPYINAADWNIVVRTSATGSPFVDWLGQFFGGLPHAIGLVVGFVLLIFVVTAGVYAVLRRRSLPVSQLDILLYVALVLITSVAASDIFFRWLHYTRQPWYSLPLFSMCITSVDVLLAVSGGPVAWLRLTRIGLAVVTALVLVPVNFSRATERQTNIDLVAKAVAAKAAKDDFIIVNPWQIGIPFSWYYKGQATWVTVPQLDDHRFHRYDLIKRKMMDARPLDDVLEKAAATLRAGKRLWIVGGATLSATGTAPTPLPPAPGSAFGWDNVAYRRSWSQQLGWFLQEHTAEGQPIETAEGLPINPLEKVPLWETQGWKP